MRTLRHTLSTRLVLGLTTALAGLVIALMPVTTANAAETAPTQRRGNNYGAIAFAVDGTFGYSFDYPTRRGAKARATRECDRRTAYRCANKIWVRNGCLAVAVREQNGFIVRYAWSVRRFKGPAKAAAKRRLAGGRILAWVCTTR